MWPSWGPSLPPHKSPGRVLPPSLGGPGSGAAFPGPDRETPQGKLLRAPAPPLPALRLTEHTGSPSSETNHPVA